MRMLDWVLIKAEEGSLFISRVKSHGVYLGVVG